MQQPNTTRRKNSTAGMATENPSGVSTQAERHLHPETGMQGVIKERNRIIMKNQPDPIDLGK